MHTATQRPMRFILELAPEQLPTLISQVLTQVTAHLTFPGASPRPTPDPDDDEDDDDDAPLPRTADPPATVKDVTAAGSPVPAGYKLGRLCVRGHRWEGTRQSLRGLSSGKCVQCMREHRQRRKAPQPLAPVTPLAPVLAPLTDGGPARPTLPQHLALTTFLSPIVCAEVSHRYRNMPEWTLRDLADERCTMCVMQQRPLALAGD